MHGGNPHLYMYLKDDKTGSSYALRTLGTNKMIITPQYHSDTSAFEKLVDYLTDRFSEYEELKEVSVNG